ncbi:hypothetical protein EJ06DRAFT_91279 [Trichodelitschia bisporula]|uniref:Uncharacterized protein n=1 Tax=Trichodelitschia bisporula TaxID=703511 RepID=A0A6G1HRX5_9PEZI|nr:hypothetical protein EJ06DRAFT_91279 [Trichodelitschia bisporula]
MPSRDPTPEVPAAAPTPATPLMRSRSRRILDAIRHPRRELRARHTGERTPTTPDTSSFTRASGASRAPGMTSEESRNAWCMAQKMDDPEHWPAPFTPRPAPDTGSSSTPAAGSTPTTPAPGPRRRRSSAISSTPATSAPASTPAPPSPGTWIGSGRRRVAPAEAPADPTTPRVSRPRAGSRVPGAPSRPTGRTAPWSPTETPSPATGWIPPPGWVPATDPTPEASSTPASSTTPAPTNRLPEF